MEPDSLTPFFHETYGHQPESLARAPGRMNLMGRHVDHQGSDVNMLALDRHVCLAAARNGTSQFRFRNVDQREFPDFDFTLSEIPIPLEGEWEAFIDHPEVINFRNSIPLWCRYLVGSILRTSLENESSIPALDIFVHGDLPPAAGLASSSALVLCMTLTVDALLDCQLELAHKLKVSSESERITGMKGGNSDPAAMLTAQPGRIVQLGCLPFKIKGTHPFSDRYRIILANSHQKAEKGEGARNEYNWRVGAYRIALCLLKRFHPEWQGRMEQLRDIHPEQLEISQANIYRTVSDLPERITREELASRYPEEAKQLEQLFAAHTEPEGGYPLREILVYGLGEMARARQIGELLQQEDYEAVGRWIRHSHDGDRVSRREDEEQKPWPLPPFDDQAMARLIRSTESNDPEADLALQCGAYRCGTFRVDEMVDICQSVDGCLGAQILGAGLGGSIMALVESGAESDVIERLSHQYYDPRGLPRDAQVTTPGPGASVEIL